MLTKIVAIAALGIVSPVLSQVFACDGLRDPDYDECDYLTQGWRGTIDSVKNEDCAANYCNTWRREDNSGNCVAIICFHVSECIGEPLRSLSSYYENMIKYNCEPIDSGGTVPGDDYDFGVYNNPAYTGSGEVMEARSLSRSVSDDGVVQNVYTLEDFNELFNITAGDSKQTRSNKRQTTSERSSSHARQEDGDDFKLLESYSSVAKPGERFRASGILSSGVTQTWSFTEGKSVSVATSVGVSLSLFEIFTASADITTTQEESQSVSDGLSFTVGDCPNEAVVYYVPLWNHYVGYWSSDTETDWHAWIPVAQDDYVMGRFETECLG